MTKKIKMDKPNKYVVRVIITSLIVIVCLIVISCLIIKNAPKGVDLKIDQIELASKAIDETFMPAFENIEESDLAPHYLSVMKEKCSYEVTEVEEKNGKIFAKVTVHSFDLYSIAKKLDETYGNITEVEKIDQYLSEELKNSEMVTTELEIELIKTENGYSAVLTNEFVNAYYGNIQKLRHEYILSLWEELKK